MFHVEHWFCRIAGLRNVPRGTFRGVLSPALWRFLFGFCFFSGRRGGLGGAFFSKLPFPLPGRRWGPGSLGAGWPRHRPPPHAAFRTRCTPTVQRVRSEAHYAAAVPRLARPTSGGGPGKAGKSAALPHRAEAKPGPPHAVRIRTDTFLCPEKCPGCRVRWGWAGRSTSIKAALSFIRAALGYGQLCAGWPRPCPPPHAAFRTRCTRTVQRVRSEAHYAAAVPRLARPASCGGQGETGQSAAPPCRIALACPFPSLLRGAILESNSQQKEAF